MLTEICLRSEEVEGVSKFLKYPCYRHSIWEVHKADMLLLHSVNDSTKME